MKQKIIIALVAVISLAACSKDSDPEPTITYTLNKTSVTLNYDESEKFTVSQGSTVQNASQVKFTSSDPKVGIIGADGVFEAKRIGTTTVTAVIGQTTLSANVTVEPYSQLATEPHTGFGATFTEVKAKEKRVIIAEDQNSLIYRGESAKVRNVQYLFEAGRVKSAALLLANTEAVVQESINFYQERYDLVGSLNGVIFFENEKAVVGLSVHETLGFVAIYLSPEELKTSGLTGMAKSYQKTLLSTSLN